MTAKAFARLPADVVLAAERIRPHVRVTPYEHSVHYSAVCEANVGFKLENLQFTNSFKLRGAVNKLLCLYAADRERGCVAASSGNHGAAVAYALQRLGASGCVFVPQGTSPIKVDAIKRYGAEVQVFGEDGLDTELEARRYADAQRMPYLSPYNDLDVVAGQGTVACELAQQAGDLDAVFVAVGGGGLIGGIGAFLKSLNPQIQVIGCQPAASAVMAASVMAGKVLELPSGETLSDGTAGGIEADALTFALCQEVVDEFVEVAEAEIAEAMCTFIDTHHQLIEGAAGVAVAALLKRRQDYRGKNLAVVICGSNVSRPTLQQVLEAGI